jgi:uncharacterized protein (TIGR02284 family)
MAIRSERGVMNHLIETCTDAARGFRAAAEHVKDAEMKAVFAEIAAERERFAAALLPHAQRLGGDAAADGTTAGAIHRGWIDLVSVLRHNDRAILTEAARGDLLTMSIFKDAVNGLLPPEARQLVEQQYTDIRMGHARVVALGQTGAGI